LLPQTPRTQQVESWLLQLGVLAPLVHCVLEYWLLIDLRCSTTTGDDANSNSINGTDAANNNRTWQWTGAHSVGYVEQQRQQQPPFTYNASTLGQSPHLSSTTTTTTTNTTRNIATTVYLLPETGIVLSTRRTFLQSFYPSALLRDICQLPTTSCDSDCTNNSSSSKDSDSNNSNGLDSSQQVLRTKPHTLVPYKHSEELDCFCVGELSELIDFFNNDCAFVDFPLVADLLFQDCDFQYKYPEFWNHLELMHGETEQFLMEKLQPQSISSSSTRRYVKVYQFFELDELLQEWQCIVDHLSS
jgi:hypothetical protein